MRYRTLGRTGLRVGEIGMGCEGFLNKSPEQVAEMVDVMEAGGVNCIDLYAPCGDGGKSSSSRPICAPFGRTASISGPGIRRRSGRASRTSSGGWRRTMRRSA